MKIIIDDMLKNKVESIRLGCLIYDVKVKEKNEELWKKFDKEIFPALISFMENKGINDIENIFLSKKAYKSLGKDPIVTEYLQKLFIEELSREKDYIR